MTPYQLKEKVLEKNPESLFFSKNNMKFAGDTMSNFAVLKPVEIKTNMGEKRMCYELKRKKPVKMGIQSSFWFCAESFELVWKSRPSDDL
jgi:hypothetical protein